MQTSATGACSLIAECSLYYAKIYIIISPAKRFDIKAYARPCLTGRLAEQYGPFGRAIRAVRRCNTACFRMQNGTYGQHAGNQPLSNPHFLPLRYGHRHCRRAGLQHALTATGTKRQRWHTTIAGREPPPRLPFAEACRQRYQPATGGVGQSRFCSWKSMSACTTKNTSAGSKSPRPSSDALAHT